MCLVGSPNSGNLEASSDSQAIHSDQCLTEGMAPSTFTIPHSKRHRGLVLRGQHDFSRPLGVGFGSAEVLYTIHHHTRGISCLSSHRCELPPKEENNPPGGKNRSLHIPFLPGVEVPSEWLVPGLDPKLASVHLLGTLSSAQNPLTFGAMVRTVFGYRYPQNNWVP